MITSTSSKLYDFLKGYETCCYTGAPLREVQSSLSELLYDELSLHQFQDEEQLLSEKAVHSAFLSADSYITKFYSRMKNVKDGDSLTVKAIADKAKRDAATLSMILSILMRGATVPLGCIGFGSLTAKGAVACTMDICDKCPYYIKGKFCLFWQNLEIGSDDLIGQAFKFELYESRYLALALLKLASGLLTIPSVTINNLSDCFMLFNHLLCLSKAYELMNPSGEARQIQIDETKDFLTREPLNYEDPTYIKYEVLLKGVFADITEGKKAYIQDIRNALIVNKDTIQSKYDPELDVYYSLKGTGQSKFTHQHKSLISSIYEIDIYADLFQEFDTYVGYHSPYKKMDANLDIERDKLFGIRTILINNPGKFKGRIIHIFDNPLQDRANYVHRRTKKILSSMQCDCTENQDKGRIFLKEETLQWSVSQPTDKIGIYNFDFSNATDTLDQKFQYLVLEFVFGPEIARFWDKLSKLRKFVQNVDGSYEGIDQRCGQPQGALGSFNCFSLAHHFIFLMDMKALGFEEHRATEFYRILGDDSTCNSIVPEYEYYNEDVIVYDKENIPRSTIEMLHFEICEKFAGFVINYDKSESAHWDSEEAKLDFAKVTYRNGQFFSPLPFRLAMRYSRSDYSRLACAIWRGERHEPKAIEFMDCVLDKIDNFTLTSIVKSGMLPFLDAFQDNTIQYDEVWTARLRYAITISHMTLALSFLTMEDKKRDFIYENSVDQGFMDLFKGLNIALDELSDLPTNHKIWDVVQKNGYIVDLIRSIYSFEDENTDDMVLAILISPLSKDLEGKAWLLDELSTLAHTAKILRLAKANPNQDVGLIFPDVPRQYVKELQKFSNKFMSRGIAKKPREEAVLLRTTLGVLTGLDEILGYVHPVKVEKSSTVDPSAVVESLLH